MSPFKPSSIVLRDNQQRVIDEIRAAYDDGKKHPMLVASTGFGKTICFSYIAENAAYLNNRVFIIVHMKPLIRQTIKALKNNGIPHGVIAAGYPMTDTPIQVVSLQTLVRRFDQLEPPELIIFDEAHHLKAKTYLQVLDWSHGKSHFLSVTATPVRADGKGFSDVCDILIEADSIGKLMDDGWLVRPKYYAPPIPGVNIDDLTEEQVEHEFDRPIIIGSAIQHYKEYLPHYPPNLVFCRNIKHAERVADQYCAAGIPSASIDGTMDDFTREKIIHQLETKVIKCLMSVNLISEGFDLPVIISAQMLRKIGPKCIALLIQQIGRLLRPSPGKTEAYLFDHVKNLQDIGYAECDRFGRPWDWQKLFHGELPKEPKDKAGALATCPKCYAVFPPEPKCPDCGHNMKERGPGGKTEEPIEIEGKLIEIDPSKLEFKATTSSGRRKQEIKKLERLA